MVVSGGSLLLYLLSLTLTLSSSHSSSSSHLRAMLGINQKPDDAPPLPLPIPSSDPNLPLHHPQHRSHPSVDASTSPSSSFISIPPSPVTTEPRPSTSSALRPFPFLGGMRRKSAHSNAPKPSASHLTGSGPPSSAPSSGLATSPTTSTATITGSKISRGSLGNRVYTVCSSDLLQQSSPLIQTPGPTPISSPHLTFISPKRRCILVHCS